MQKPTCRLCGERHFGPCYVCVTRPDAIERVSLDALAGHTIELNEALAVKQAELTAANARIEALTRGQLDDMERAVAVKTAELTDALTVTRGDLVTAQQQLAEANRRIAELEAQLVGRKIVSGEYDDLLCPLQGVMPVTGVTDKCDDAKKSRAEYMRKYRHRRMAPTGKD